MRLGAVRWSRLAWTALITINAVLLAITLAAFFLAPVGIDWGIYSEAGGRIGGGLYDWPGTVYAFRYSPLAAYVFALIAPIGYLGWTGLHVAALLLIPRRLALFTLLSWPFWDDLYNGNVMTFVFVAAVLALQGRKTGQVAFLALALLIPRPLMLPLLAWLVWWVPWTRLPLLGLVVVNAIGVWLTGYGPAWIAALLSRGADDLAARVDFGPAHLIGPLWIPLGLALAAWLTWKGRLGLASIAASPFWLPPYLLMALLEVQGPAKASIRRGPEQHARAARPGLPSTCH